MLAEVEQLCRWTLGYFFMSGRLMRRLGNVMKRDRVYLADGSGTETQTENGRCLNIFPTGAERGAGDGGNYSFKVTATGTGTDVTVERGFVNTKEPGNMTATFTASDGADSFLYVTGSFASSTGILNSCSLGIGTAMPTDPEGGDGMAPATSTRPIAIIRASGGTITDIIPCVRGCLNVAPVVRKVDCGINTLGYLWSVVVPDVGAEMLGSILDRLAALEN